MFGVKDGILGVKDGFGSSRKLMDDMFGVEDGMKGIRVGLKDTFSGGKSANSVDCDYRCTYKDDGDIPVSLASQNYQDAIKDMSLERDIQESHTNWIGAVDHRTTTASKETVRDDPNDINPWVGPRRPKYKTCAQPLAEARTIASDIPCEMIDNSSSYQIW